MRKNSTLTMKLFIRPMVYAISGLMVIGCGAFIGNPKKPKSEDSPRVNGLVTLAESSSENLKGFKLYISEQTAERPQGVTLLPGQDVASSFFAKSLQLPEDLVAISYPVAVEIDGELTPELVSLLALEIPLKPETDAALIDRSRVVVIYRSPDGFVGYESSSKFLTAEPPYIFNLVRLGTYQLAMLSTIPPEESLEVTDTDNGSSCSSDMFAKTLAENGGGVEGNEYVICTLDQLDQLRGLATNSWVILGTNIDAAATFGWDPAVGGTARGFLPIGASDDGLTVPLPEKRFSGVFDGRGRTIHRLHINRIESQYVGLFAATTDTAIIKNIVFTEASVTALSIVGIVAGHACGTLQNISASGVVTAESDLGLVSGLFGDTSYFSTKSKIVCAGVQADGLTAGGSITGANRVGGLFGAAGGRVSNSSTSVTVVGQSIVGGAIGGTTNIVDAVRSNGSVHGTKKTGGLIGIASGVKAKISRSWSSSAISGDDLSIGGLIGLAELRSSVETSFATGEVEGDLQIGGLIGTAGVVFIRESYATGKVIGKHQAGGLIGLFSGDAGDDGTGIENCFATGAVVGKQIGDPDQYLGGLIGEAGASQSMKQVYFTGTITGGLEVVGIQYIGSIIGFANDQFELKNILYDGTGRTALPDVGYQAVAGGANYDDPEITVSTNGAMKIPPYAVFTGAEFNFSSVWMPGVSGSYPTLRRTPAI